MWIFYFFLHPIPRKLMGPLLALFRKCDKCDKYFLPNPPVYQEYGLKSADLRHDTYSRGREESVSAIKIPFRSMTGLISPVLTDSVCSYKTYQKDVDSQINPSSCCALHPRISMFNRQRYGTTLYWQRLFFIVISPMTSGFVKERSET